MSKSKHKWIKKAIGEEGAGKLHKKLGVPKDEKIPAEKLEKAAHSKDPTEKKEAVLAKTMRGFNHKKAYSK